MSPPEILTLAKQGSPKAIAVLINHSTKPQGVTAQVAKRGDCLHVLLEAEQVPNPQTAMVLLRRSLKLLDVESVHTVMIYARRYGQKAAAWQQAIQLKSYSLIHSPVSNNLDPSDTPAPIAPSTPAAIETSPRQITSTRTASSAAKPAVVVEQPNEETAKFLKRPEAVILVVFVTLLMFWDMYLSMLDELAAGTALTTRRLAERLGTSTTTIRRRRTQPDFSAWSQKLDPEGIAWSYHNSLYVPQVFSEFEDAPAS